MIKIDSNLFDPERSLFSLPVVQWTFSLFFLVAIALAVAIAINDPAPFSMTSKGLNNAVEYFKIPLAILAIGLTFIGIYGANHRSEQTKRQIERALLQIQLTTSQIEMTKGQNNFSNFYKHIEEFGKYCDSVAGEIFKIPQPRQLHRIIFPKANATSEDYKLSDNFIADIDNLINTFFDIFKGFNDHSIEKRIAAAYSIQQNIKKFEEKYNFKISNQGIPGKQYTTNTKSFVLLDGGMRKLLADFILLVSKSDELLSFDITHLPNNNIQSLLKINLSHISGSTDLESPFNLKSHLNKQLISIH